MTELVQLSDWRNPAYNSRGTIDLEILVNGEWLPFTANPDDVEEHGRALHAAAVASGNIAAYVPPTAEEARALLPDLTMRQFRLGLLSAGLLDVVIAAVDSLGGAAQIEFEYASTVKRDNTLVTSLIETLNLTDSHVDAMWADAANL